MKPLKSKTKLNVGVLALQGGFQEHLTMLRNLKVPCRDVRNLNDAKDITHLILPGGESTVLRKLLDKTGLYEWIFKKGRAGFPIFGTCAGMIILAKNHMRLIDIEVARNAYGRQLSSFEDTLSNGFPGIFIRAPKIKTIGPKVEVLARHGKDPVWLQQQNIMVASFHPELTENPEIHKTFLGIDKYA